MMETINFISHLNFSSPSQLQFHEGVMNARTKFANILTQTTALEYIDLLELFQLLSVGTHVIMSEI